MKNKIIILAVIIIFILVIIALVGFFYLTMYKKSNLVFKSDLENCFELTGSTGFMSNKDRCLFSVLKKIGKNPDYLYICNNFDIDNFKIECEASLSGDVDICLKMNPAGDFSKNEVVEACYYAYAESQGFKQKDICKKINNSSYRDTCYFQYFQSTGDKSICKEITEPLYLEECK